MHRMLMMSGRPSRPKWCARMSPSSLNFATTWADTRTNSVIKRFVFLQQVHATKLIILEKAGDCGNGVQA